MDTENKKSLNIGLLAHNGSGAVALFAEQDSLPTGKVPCKSRYLMIK